ncbi:DUF418 domain-containing protein [Streptomyces sp. NPDC127119]|uniref:DUF418 domain-containing protein n=1 Tax=Streptomyces sp. NPDC127119 TaxID=3345370 RepID=UPI00363D41ED
MLTAPALTATHVCGLLLLLDSRRGGDRAVCWPRPLVRPANYLTRSLLMALVFTGCGLAGDGRWATTAILTGCLVPYAVQLVVSRWLLRSVRYGPVEWLLRTVTSARRP